MRRLMRSGALVCLTLGAVLSGAAQDAGEADEVDACVAAVTADWSLPQTVEEAKARQEALAELVAGCSAGTAAGAESGSVGDAEEGLSEADSGFPRTMYVTSRVPRINVRRYASTSSAVVATLAHAAPVEVLGRAQGASYRGNAVWFRIGAGYVHSLLLGETKPAPLLPTPTPVPVTEPQDNRPPQQQQQQQQAQQQGGQQRQAEQPRQQSAPEGQRPPDEGTGPPDDDTGGEPPQPPPPTVQPPDGDLIFVPLTLDEWKAARRRLFGDDG